MKDVKTRVMLDLIPRLVSGGALRRADSPQEPAKKRGGSMLTLNLMSMRDPRVRKG